MSLQASWARTTKRLLEARGLLHAPDGLLEEFARYLEHNELALALDELEAIALEQGASAGFWQKAAEAAEEMGLEQLVQRYQSQAKG